MRKLIHILVPVIMLSGCFDDIDERSLIGRYHFNTYKPDIIDLRKDHTYDHEYANTKGEVFKCHGKWRYNGKEILFTISISSIIQVLQVVPVYGYPE